MIRFYSLAVVIAGLLILELPNSASAGRLIAQDDSLPKAAAVETPIVAAEGSIAKKIDDKTKSRYEKFAKEMSGVKLIGTFTIDGQKGKFREEEYTIDKIEKAPKGNLWTFTCRIKYGKINVPVPLTIPVEWAGDTPMVGISNFKIPLVGSGSFGARVIFYDRKYAGTWSHDKVGGHMFGRIVKIKSEKPKAE